MSLRKDAIKLSSALNEIVAGLLSYDSNGSYARDTARRLANRLGPLVEAYDRSVFVQRSRQEACEAVSDLAECMDAISAYSATGEMDFGISKALGKYWQFHTIFRESRYRDESL